MDYIRAIERQQIREDIPQVRVADNVKAAMTNDIHYGLFGAILRLPRCRPATAL